MYIEMLLYVIIYLILIILYLKEKKKITSITLERDKIFHELKNQITICNGYIDILKLKNKRNIKYIEIIKKELKRSLYIIQSYKNKLNLQIFNIKTLFDDINNVYSLKLEKDNIELNFYIQNDTKIKGDYDKLKQVLINIINNSMDAKKQNDILKIDVDVENNKNSIKLIVTDNGQGIKKIKKIFSAYYTTKKNGNGLGVIYCKKIIKLHKGTIKYLSKIDKGTKVIITLPQKKKV